MSAVTHVFLSLLLLTSGFSNLAWARGEILTAKPRERVVIENPSSVEVISTDRCAASPENCASRILRQLGGISFTSFKLGMSGRPLSSSRDFFGTARLTGVEFDMPLGHLAAMDIGIARLGPADPFRWSTVVLRSDSVYLCRDEKGKAYSPFFGRIERFCVPRGTVGFSSSVVEMQSEPSTKRLAARWAEARAVFNLLRNGLSGEHLSRRVLVTAGMSADSVFFDRGTTRATEHFLRGAVGLRLLWRSRLARWETTGKLDYRPTLFSNKGSFRSQGWEAEVGGVHYFPVRRHALISTGLSFQYAHWSDPASSIGLIASTVTQQHWGILFTIGGRFEFAGY